MHKGFILLHNILFYSILFYSILFYSIPYILEIVYSILIYSSREEIRGSLLKHADTDIHNIYQWWKKYSGPSLEL